MIDACLTSRAHYLDITGEIDVFLAAQRRHADAQAAGIVICPGVGFDVIPTDCIAAVLKEALPDASESVIREPGRTIFRLIREAPRCSRSEEGIAQLQQCVTLWRSSGAEVGVPLFLTFLADAYGKAGRPEEGLKQIAEAVPLHAENLRRGGKF
jgi:hypothetical protein